MRKMVVMLGVLAVAGCQTDAGPTTTVTVPPDPALASNYRRPSDTEAMADARKVVAGKLKDPESARFTDMARRTSPNARGEPTDVICGKVNAKNAYGGYTGAKAFVYMVSRKESISTEDATVGPIIINTFCGA